MAKKKKSSDSGAVALAFATGVMGLAGAYQARTERDTALDALTESNESVAYLLRVLAEKERALEAYASREATSNTCIQQLREERNSESRRADRANERANRAEAELAERNRRA